MAKYSKLDADLYFVVVTNGCRSGKNKFKTLIETRKKESKLASALLNIKPICLNYEDGNLFYDKEIYQKIIDIIHEIKPDLIFTHNPEDYHTDHRTLSKVVYDAASFKVPVIYADSMNGVNFNPDFYINITDEIEIKKRMILNHKSQISQSLCEKALLLNSFRGLQFTGKIGYYAEAFKLSSGFNIEKVWQYLPLK